MAKGNALGAKRLPGKYYELPGGRIVTNRQFQKLRVEKTVGRPLSNERYAKLNGTVKKQVELSQAFLSLAEKRELALDAARIGLSRPTGADARRMHRILRNQLQLPREAYVFFWGDHQS